MLWRFEIELRKSTYKPDSRSLLTASLFLLYGITTQGTRTHGEAQGLAQGGLRDGRQEPAALRLLLGLQRHGLARGTALQEDGESGEIGACFT